MDDKRQKTQVELALVMESKVKPGGSLVEGPNRPRRSMEAKAWRKGS